MNEHGVGEVSIGCPESIASGFLPAVLDRLSQKYPRISVLAAQVNTPTVEFRELEERQLDLVLALLAVPDPHRVPAEYAVEILFGERLCIVVGRNNPLASRRKIDFND